jgi:uncharacterized membrane protein YeaQ/YmgE (transglycosylase-associated protein family)
VRAATIVLFSIVTAVYLGEDRFSLVVAGVLPGASLGAYLEGQRVRFSTAGSWTQRLLRAVIGAALLGMIFAALWFVPLPPELETPRRVLTYAVLGIGVTAGFPYVGWRMGLFSATRHTRESEIAENAG